MLFVTSCLGMSISSRWKSPLRVTAMRVLSLSRAIKERLCSITKCSTMASMSGIENAPCIITRLYTSPSWITQSCLVQLQVPRHGLVLVKAGVHQFLYLRKLMRAGNLVCHLRSLLTHDVLLLVTQCILDMTGPIPLTPVYY